MWAGSSADPGNGLWLRGSLSHNVCFTNLRRPEQCHSRNPFQGKPVHSSESQSWTLKCFLSLCETMLCSVFTGNKEATSVWSSILVVTTVSCVLQARISAEASMDPSHPCKRVMAHLRVGFEDHLKGIPHEHVRQILSLVLLATSLKAAGQPGGMASAPHPLNHESLRWASLLRRHRHCL